MQVQVLLSLPNGSEWCVPFVLRSFGPLKLNVQAFHDMANHNVDDGTGGVDGSIVYELGRPAVCCFTSFLCLHSI